MPKEEKPIGVRNYLILAFSSAVVVGVIVFGGVRKLEETLVWAGITFIVVLVGIATLALSVKPSNDDPDQPKLK
ncbi:MAG: hypothetical protein WCO24_03250 [Actinomycetes bacterium]